ncbi:MAG: hypothetical protein ACFNVV_04795 [Bacteroidota bacterium]
MVYCCFRPTFQIKVPYILLYVYLHTDHLGSATLITDDYAQIAEQIAYMPYGEDWVDIRHHGYFGSAYIGRLADYVV